MARTVVSNLGFYLFLCFLLHMTISMENCDVSPEGRMKYLQSLPWVACECDCYEDTAENTYGAELHPDDEHTK